MRRLYLAVPAVIAAAVALTLARLPGGSAKGNPGGGAVRKARRALQAVGPGTGTLTGKVVLDGPKPNVLQLTDELLKAINAKADDKDYCLKSPEDQKTAQEWRVGDDNGVGNVFVWIEPLTRGEFFQIDEKQLAKVTPEVVMSQPYCAFVPHCAVLFPKYRDPTNPRKRLETGQKFVVRNDARIAHNVSMSGGADNPGGNETLPPKKDYKPQVFEPSREPIVFRCNIHPWMSAYARAFDHPYATLTAVAPNSHGRPTGAYEIKDVPAGKVRVIAWHEKAGYLNTARGEEITLTDGANTHDFKAKAK